jgi:hypothetical protein
MGVERERERNGVGETRRARSVPGVHPIQVTNTMLGKTPLSKTAHEKKSHVQEQSSMAGLNCQAGQGKMAQHRLWARRGFYRRGRLRKLAHARKSPVGVGLFYSAGISVKGLGCHLGPFTKWRQYYSINNYEVFAFAQACMFM